MVSLLLSLALISEPYKSIRSEKQFQELKSDFFFERAVSEFILESHPKIPAIIIGLDNPKYAVRKVCIRLLKEQRDYRTRKWLFAGLKSKKADTRYNCYEVLKYFYRCKKCNGTGECLKYEPPEYIQIPGEERFEGDGPCKNCGYWHRGRGLSMCYDCLGEGSFFEYVLEKK